MQTVYKDGTYGEPEQFDRTKMMEAMSDLRVAHVRVYDKDNGDSNTEIKKNPGKSGRRKSK